MKLGHVLIGFAIGAVLAFPVLTHGGTAEEASASGKALMAKGDFQGALAAYAKAAQADRHNQEYLQQYSLLRRVLYVRQRLETEQDPQQWEYLARALHSFYVSEGLYSEAVALDRKVHSRLNTAASAVMLAESELALSRNAEAAEMLAALDASKATPSTQALLGLALSRLGKVDEARQIAQTVILSDQASPGLVYTLARVYAITGNSSEALEALTCCFASLPPSRQAGLKTHAKQCPDFKSLASTSEFAKVLETKSKIPESSCSGGSGCAGCPMRSKCARSQ